MDLRDDERAQTVQVGAILLLGTLVIALSVYQVTSVPGQNGVTEFTHNQHVHEQLQEVRTAILDTAAEDTGRSATVALGIRYRDRIVAVNPGPLSGTLRTTDLGAVAIGNAVAARSPDTRDLWNGSQKRYSSTALTYEPNYNEYSNAPTTIYEHSVLARPILTARSVGTNERLPVPGEKRTARVPPTHRSVARFDRPERTS